VISELEAAFVVLRAECATIDRDLSYLSSLREKYPPDYDSQTEVPEPFERSIRALTALRASKKTLIADIAMQMDLFALHTRPAGELIRKLRKAGVHVSVGATEAKPTITAESRLLANTAVSHTESRDPSHAVIHIVPSVDIR
jgi:hypothetical protein